MSAQPYGRANLDPVKPIKLELGWDFSAHPLSLKLASRISG
jgi:hypothetical protein